MADAFERGKKLLSSQSYEIRNCVVDGDEVSVEVLWTGAPALSFGILSAGFSNACPLRHVFPI